MCLILFAHRAHAALPLVVAANRDECYQRPTREAGFWPEEPRLLAGRDLQAGGTWMGITRQGRFAAVTNFRDGESTGNASRSRGELTRDFLLGESKPLDYAHQVLEIAHEYAGFNLLVGDTDDLVYCENLGNTLRQIPPGVYGLSNHLLDSPWPKVVRGKNRLTTLLKNWRSSGQADSRQLLNLLTDNSIADDLHLPDTGVGLALERCLSPIFIEADGYGTCSSTVIAVDREQQVKFHERSFYFPTPRDVVFQFALEPAGRNY
ncbi:MAG: NRDE family protein [Cellvibrionaceae bacterium]